MKKTLLSLAVAACCVPVVAMAEADIYGQFRASLNSTSDASNIEDGLGVSDNTSVFGFKAKTDGDGPKAFVHFQSGAPAGANGGVALAQRFYFAGLEGDMGKVAYGRLSNAYKMVGFKMDPFYNHMSVNAGSAGEGVSGGGATYGLSGVNNGFTDSSLELTSKAMGGMTFNAGVYVDTSGDGDDSDDHSMGAGVKWKSGAINAGLQFMSQGKSGNIAGGDLVADGTAVRFHGGYATGGMSINLSFEQVDTSTANTGTFMFLAGKFAVSETMRAALTFGSVAGDDLNDGTAITAGVFATVAPGTELFLSTSSASLDADMSGNDADPSVFSLGAIHKF